jgi:hypothetical protein
MPGRTIIEQAARKFTSAQSYYSNDADKICRICLRPILHVVRNPCPLTDTKKRPVPLSLEGYLTAWVETQYHALVFQKLHPDRIHIVRYEDVIEALGRLLRICAKLGLEASDSLEMPTWNETRWKRCIRGAPFESFSRSQQEHG